MSLGARLNGLRDLEARIKSLPDQERLKRQRDIFQNARVHATDRVDTLRTVIRQVATLRMVGGNPRLLETEERTCLSAVRDRATELSELLSRPSPPSTPIGTQFDATKRATTVLATSVNATWSAMCQQYSDRADALRPLAQRVSPTALAPLQALVHLLMSSSTPPTTPHAVQSLRDAIQRFSAAIQSMQIDGAVGQFLRDASTTGADPRALFVPEIKKYLDDNPQLWAALRVGLK
jgi:hypothetical protein